MRFMIKEKGGVNADVFIEFLKRLMVGAPRPIFLIVDRGPGASREEDHGVRRYSGWKTTAVFSASLFAGSQSRRVGMEASESRYRRTQRHSELRGLQGESEIVDVFPAAQR
jgi:hypothetical protein